MNLKEKIKNNLTCRDGIRIDSNKLKDEKYKELLNEINEAVLWGTTYAEKISCILNNITQQPRCIYCNSPITIYHKSTKKYSKHCSKECSNSSDYTKERRAETFLKKYGYTTYLSSPDGIKTAQKTKLEKKLKHPLKSKHRNHISQETWEKINSRNWLYSEHIIKKKSTKQISIELGDVGSNFICKKLYECGIEPVKTQVSFDQNQISAFIQTHNIICELSTKKYICPKEIDIYIPDYKFGIEFHGQYWHSFNRKETKRERFYNYEKYCDASKVGIKLYQIFEHEWNNTTKQEIWKSIILNQLGKSQRLFARKCAIQEVSAKEAKEFLNENHLQGYCNSSINIALYNSGDIIAIMTFGKSRYGSDSEYELLRYVSSKGLSVVGGASRLLKYFERKYQPKSIKTYADIRHSSGNLYDKLGFTFLHDSSPNYWYYKKDKILTRYQCQKHKLKKLLKNFSNDLSEYENMFAHNYRRFWDAGNKVYIKKY